MDEGGYYCRDPGDAFVFLLVDKRLASGISGRTLEGVDLRHWGCIVSWYLTNYNDPTVLFDLVKSS